MESSTLRIVARQRGSWKYQDAYGVVEYTIGTTKDGRQVWKSTCDVVRKASWPQLRRMGYTHLSIGSLHNRPVQG